MDTEIPAGFEIASIGPDEFKKALELQGRVFQLPSSYFETLVLKDPLFEYENVLVAKHRGRIVSQVQVFPKVVRIGTAHAWMGGIGGVATDPEYGGKGLAMALLQGALNLMRRKGYEISLLFTGIHDFYRLLG